jgi:hypothetical protein
MVRIRFSRAAAPAVLIRFASNNESALKSLLRIFNWVGIALARIVMIVIACGWLLPDETLNPGTEKLLSVRPAPPAGHNGCFMFLGMRASPELDPHAVGQKIVAEHERLVAAQGDLTKFEFESFLGNTPLSISGPGPRLCDIEKEKCLAVYQGMQPGAGAETGDPFCKILVSGAAPNFSDYSFRLHDLTGYSRLIELQRRMVEGDVRPEKFAEFLAGAGRALMAPYAGKPMEWNEANGTISFAGHGKRFLKDGRMIVELGHR